MSLGRPDATAVPLTHQIRPKHIAHTKQERAIRPDLAHSEGSVEVR